MRGRADSLSARKPSPGRSGGTNNITIISLFSLQMIAANSQILRPATDVARFPLSLFLREPGLRDLLPYPHASGAIPRVGFEGGKRNAGRLQRTQDHGQE